jgi:hypothetical protein
MTEFLFLLQVVEPEVITQVLPVWDFGLAIGTISSLFAFIWFAFNRTLRQFEKIAFKHDETIRIMCEEHHAERMIWRDEGRRRSEKIDALCDRMIAALSKIGEL